MLLASSCCHHLDLRIEEDLDGLKKIPGAFTVLSAKTPVVPPRGTPWELGTLRPQAKLVGDLGAGWSPRDIVGMTHRRVDPLCHLTNPNTCCLAGWALLGKG